MDHNNNNSLEISWDDASQSSEGLGLLFWDDVSMNGEGGSAHGSLNSLRGIGSQMGGDSNEGVTNNDSGQALGLQNNGGQMNNGQVVVGQGNHLNLNQQAQAQAGMIQWNDWNSMGGANGQQQLQQQQVAVGAEGDDTMQSNAGLSGMGMHEAQQHQKQQQQPQAQELQSFVAQATNQSQTPNESSQSNNSGMVMINPQLQNSANASNQLQNNQLQMQLQSNSGIPQNLPPQAHPFYLWMLQQQQQQQCQQTPQVQAQQAQVQQDAQRLAEQQQQQAEAQRIAHAQQQEKERQKEEARRQQEAQMLQQAQATDKASNTTNLNPQQQLALFQYQLALAQSQQNGAAQIGLPQAQQGGENFLVQQQFQLLQTLQQQANAQQHHQVLAQQVQQNTPSIQSLGGVSPFQPALAATQQPMPPPNQTQFQPILAGPSAPTPNQSYINTASLTENTDPVKPSKAAPAKKSRRTRKKADSPKTAAVVAAHRQAAGVIGNTMKSLNNTMKSIHAHQRLETHPVQSPDNQVKHPVISGSMKSLNSTLANTLTVPTGGPNNVRGNNRKVGDSKAETTIGADVTMNQNQLVQQQQQQQQQQMMVHAVQNNRSSTDQSTYCNSPTQNSAPITSNKKALSSVKNSDRYVTESGTDDDIMLLGARTGATTATLESKEESTSNVGKSNKERNREHAKNTRLRKKAYVESLKRTVDELCRERDALVAERANAANLMVEIHSKRVDVLRSFFALRAGYSLNQKRDLWSSILDESGFTCRLPVTPYQSFPSSEVQLSNCQRTISGVDAMIADVASNAVFLESLVDRYRHPMGKIKFQYTLVTEDAVTEGTHIMARWSMETLNARQCGARTELHQQGMLVSKFNSAHKIVSLDIMFDVMAFMLQVKMAMGFENFNDVAIPNTVQTCQKQFDYPMVMTLADRPYTIVQVNDRWENLTGYTGADVVGKCSCGILQGPDTGRKELEQLMSPVLYKRPSCGILINYTKNRRRYRSYITLYPLSTDSTVSHYFGLTTFVQWIDEDDTTESQQRDNSREYQNDNDSNSSPSKRPWDSTGAPSLTSQKSKQSKIDQNSSSCSNEASNNASVKLVQTANQDKLSLSSLTSSMSSNSMIERGSGNTTTEDNTSKECNSVAVLAPSRAKTVS